ncbi:MAG: glycosyltransferase [Acidobacteria bacterium]|nr:glycosyltransferase [Acidobacteriota bacterium]
MNWGTKALHIAHVLSALDFGGVETSALYLIHGMNRGKFKHTVISMAHSNGERRTEFESIPGVKFMKCPYTGGKRLSFITSCARLFHDLKPDRILAYNFGNHALIAGAAFFAGINHTYVRVGGSPLRTQATRWKSTVLAHAARPFCRGEIAVSQAVGSELVNQLFLPADRVTVIPNGCPVEAIFERAQSERIRRLERTPQRLLMVSRMDEAKDHQTLLVAMLELVRRQMDVQLILMGTGPEMESHRRRVEQLGIASKVVFLGSRNDVPEWMGRSDLLVHSTRSEGFPNVLIEAMAAGIPVVATDIPPCREVLADGCGLLVRRNDPSALAMEICRLLNDCQLRDAMVERAYQRVQVVYNLTRMIRAYEQALTRA